MIPVSDAERLRAREPPRGRPVMRQTWRHLGFLHWAVESAAVARLLPPGLDLDTFTDDAYVTVVPFTIEGRLSFHEVNVRTYVHRAGRDPGVWFFSLDAASRLAVAGARLTYRLPYFHARMSMIASGDTVTYISRRATGDADSPRLACRYAPVGPAAPAAPGTLEFFLAERYLLYSWDGRRMRTARVHHVPYPLQPATVTDLDETLLAAAGITRPPQPPFCHYAREVDVRIFPPRSATPLHP